MPSRLWTPLDSTGVFVWYSADSVANGLVPSWTDNVRSLPVLQADTTHQFTRAATSFNSAYPGLTSHGIPGSANPGTWMETAPATDLSFLPSGTNPSTVFAVVDQQAAPGGDNDVCNIIGYGGDDPLAGHDTRTFRRRSLSGGNHLALHDGSNPSHRDGLYDFTGCHVVAGKFEGGTAYAWFDGKPTVPASSAVPFNTTTMLWFRISGKILATPEEVSSDFWTGVYRHICVGYWSDTDRVRLEGWGAWDSGLEALLPDNHPYKNGPPVFAEATPERSLLLTDSGSHELRI